MLISVNNILKSLLRWTKFFYSYKILFAFPLFHHLSSISKLPFLSPPFQILQDAVVKLLKIFKKISYLKVSDSDCEGLPSPLEGGEMVQQMAFSLFSLFIWWNLHFLFGTPFWWDRKKKKKSLTLQYVSHSEVSFLWQAQLWYLCHFSPYSDFRWDFVCVCEVSLAGNA